MSTIRVRGKAYRLHINEPHIRACHGCAFEETGTGCADDATTECMNHTHSVWLETDELPVKEED